MELKPQRRVVTTHKGTKSAVMIDDTVLPNAGPGGIADRVLWQSHSFPADVSAAHEDTSEPSMGFYAGGSTIRIVDLPPKSTGFNHRTASLDYGIVMEGSVELVLDDGSKTIYLSVIEGNRVIATKVDTLGGESNKGDVVGEIVKA
ncbi:hypothetical protein SLS57_006101 [Botryosphaeria dothidea]